MVSPQLEINEPLISSEGVILSWNFNEEAISMCSLQPPSLISDNNMQTMTTIPCSNNSVLLESAQKGYSLYIQGIDSAGNIADPVIFTWNRGK